MSDQEQTGQPKEPPSLDEVLEQAFAQGGEEASSEESAEPAAAEAEAERQDEPAAAAEGDDPATEPEPEPVVEEPPASSDEHLAPEDKAFLDGLPEAHRKAAETWRREIKRGASEKFEAAAAARKESEELDRYFAPYADQIKASGRTRTQLVGQIVDRFTAMANDPIGSIEAYATSMRNSGAGPEQASEAIRRVSAAFGLKEQGQPTAGNGHDPNLPTDPASQKISALEREIADLKRGRETDKQEAARARISRYEQEIRDFAEAKDEQGHSTHPHFEKVKPTVGALLQAAHASGEALTLEQAYERAVWARDDLREDLIKARQAEAAKAAAATRRAENAKSRAATSPRTASVSTQPPTLVGKSIDEIVNAGWEKLAQQ